MRRFLIAALLVALFLVPMVGIQTASAQSGNVWTAFYYNNQDWAGAPVMTESSSIIYYNWGYGSPGPAVPVDNFTGRFETDAYFYPGTYRFTLTADDEITLIVGGITYIDSRGQGQSGKTFTADVNFPYAGNQHVTVYYREYTAVAYAYVDWQQVKGNSGGSGGGWGGGGGPPPAPTPPPPANCGPQSAGSVQTEFGDYTSCIQQGQHQSACYQSNGAWNAPNMGSIQTEPKIEVWGNCKQDSVTSFQVSCDPKYRIRNTSALKPKRVGSRTDTVNSARRTWDSERSA